MKTLIFDIWGEYGHYKKYYATTSALTYAFPPKTSIYGILGAMTGLSKFENEYLIKFKDKQCLIGLQLLSPIQTRRMGTNLRPDRKRYKENAKPTLMEYVYEPKYRLFITHQDGDWLDELSGALIHRNPVYTPTLGTAQLLCNFEWIGEAQAIEKKSDMSVVLNSIVPMRQFIAFGEMEGASIIEQTMFAVEMDTERQVTEREDFLMDRNNHPISAKVTHYYEIQDHGNICLF